MSKYITAKTPINIFTFITLRFTGFNLRFKVWFNGVLVNFLFLEKP